MRVGCVCTPVCCVYFNPVGRFSHDANKVAAINRQQLTSIHVIIAMYLSGRCRVDPGCRCCDHSVERRKARVYKQSNAALACLAMTKQNETTADANATPEKAAKCTSDRFFVHICKATMYAHTKTHTHTCSLE